MKTTILFLLLSITLFAQRQHYFDTILHDVPRQKIQLYLPNYKLMMCLGLATLPTGLFVTKLQSNDKLGKYVYGSIAAISVVSLTTATVLYFCDKTTDKLKPTSYSCFFLSGFMEGFNEELNNHYWKVKTKLPGLNDQFWNPDISWENKYNSNIPFSKTIGVMFTDGHHLTNWSRNVFALGGIFTIRKPDGFKYTVKKVCGVVLSYSIGKGLSHYLINN